MGNEANNKAKWTISELRGIALVVLGTATLVFYYFWWMEDARLTNPWLLMTFAIAMVYGLVQLTGNWILYLATHRRDVFDPPTDQLNLTVDVFVTACGEPLPLINRALLAAVEMRGAHRTWLLDDGDDPSLAQLAERMGVGYLTREGSKDLKAGNVNAALARTDGDIVVIFDIDHAPKPDFLERTLGYFSNPEIGFVQVMLTFENGNDGWVAQAAADSSLDFYNPTSIGSDGLRSATLVGSNALIRRKTLEAIGGYKPGLAEDLATSIEIHADGWQSVYVAEPLAPGFAPPDLAAWFTQQMKWARGVFELLVMVYPRLVGNLKLGQKISYAVRMTYYWIGPVVALHLLATVLVLWLGSETAVRNFEHYLLHLVPLAIAAAGIRQLALRRWRHRSLSPNLQIKPMLLVYVTWPIYTMAWLMALLRVPLSFRATPKQSNGNVKFRWLLPQILTLALVIAGAVRNWALFVDAQAWLTICFVSLQIYTHIVLLARWLPMVLSKAKRFQIVEESSTTVYSR